jgi:hypothetical protein
VPQALSYVGLEQLHNSKLTARMFAQVPDVACWISVAMQWMVLSAIITSESVA